MNRQVRRVCILTLVVVLALLVMPASELQAAPLKIRMGYVVAPVDWNIMLFQKTDILKNYGKSYVVEYFHFQGSSPQIQAMAAGELEGASLAFSSFANAIMNAKLDLRIAADLFQDGVPGYMAIPWMVTEKSGYKKVEDLRGKTIAINVFGAGVDAAMRAVMAKHGMTFKKDYQVVEVAFPHIETFLREGKIDAGVFVQPFYSIAKKKGGLKTIFTGTEATGRNQFVILTMRTEFLKKNEVVLRDFWDDWLRALAWWLDPKNRNEALDITAKVSKQPRSAFEEWFLTKEDFYHDPNGIPDLDALQRNVNLLQETGITKGTIDVRQYTDLSQIKAAAERMKKMK